MAAPSELLSYLCEKFPLNAIEVPTKNITVQCNACGHINKRSRDSIECGGCGETFYSETNAVLNTVAAGKQLLADGAIERLKEKHEEGLSKAKERLAKMQQAMRESRQKQNEEVVAS